jgi:hypothetical protein
MRARRILKAVVSIACFAGSASANEVIDTYPAPSPYPGQQSFTDGFIFVAQTFTTPATDPVLVSWQFELAARNAEAGNVQFSVFDWQGGAPTGTSLYSTTVPWPTVVTDPIFSDINLSLTPGHQYGVVIDLLGYSDSSVLFGPNVYSGGDGFWNNGRGWLDYPQDDVTFSAEFAPVPEPSARVLLLLASVLWLTRSLYYISRQKGVRSPNQSPEPTAVGAAVASHATSRRWLSFFR